MHVVVWTAAGEHYAIDTGAVVEVVPVVQARPIDHAPTWITGLINYRGTLVPLLDLRSLLGHGASALRQSSRVIIAELSENEDERLALLVESLKDVGHHDFGGSGARPPLTNADTPYLGPMALTDGATIQLIDVDALLGDEHRTTLFDAVAEVKP